MCRRAFHAPTARRTAGCIGSLLGCMLGDALGAQVLARSNGLPGTPDKLVRRHGYRLSIRHESRYISKDISSVVLMNEINDRSRTVAVLLHDSTLPYAVLCKLVWNCKLALCICTIVQPSTQPLMGKVSSSTRVQTTSGVVRLYCLEALCPPLSRPVSQSRRARKSIE